MLKKYLIALLPVLLIFPNVSAEVLVYNDQQYSANDDSIHIVGEIQNDLDYPINQVSIKSTLYDENGENIGIAKADSLIRTISPGMKSPFDIVLIDEELKKISSYYLEVDYKISPPKSQVIEITESEMVRDSLNNIMIKGTVTNKGDITANTVSVVATLYDRNGNVATVSKLQAEPDYLRSDDVAHFIVPIQDKTQTSMIVDYNLVAESEEFAAVPEFPIGSGLLLAGTVGAYVIITRLPNRFVVNLISAVDLR